MSEIDAGRSPVDPHDRPPPFALPMSQDVLEALPFPLIIYTRDGIYAGANTLVEQLFGVPAAALIGRFNLLEDPTSRANGTAEYFLRALAGRRIQAPRTYYNFAQVDRAGRAGCWIEATFIPFRDAGGAVAQVGMLAQDVTAQIGFEHEAAMFKALVEHASDGISVASPDGQLTYCNPAYQALTGYGPAAVGMNIAEMHPAELDELSTGAARLQEQGHWRGQMQTRRADGSSFSADVAAFVLRDSADQPLGMAAILRDLTAEQAQARNLRLTQYSLDRSSDSIHWLDPSSRLVYVNNGACAMLGYTQDELLGLSIADIDPVFPMGQWEAVWGQLKQVGVLNFESLHRRKDGSTFPVDIVASYLEFEGSEYACVIARDISERKRQEEELRIFKAMVENTPDSIAIVDLQGVYRYVNPAYRTMLRTGEDLIGKQVMDFLAPEEQASVASAMTALHEQRVAYVQARYRRADGSDFPTAATVFLQETPAGDQQLIAFVRDTSEQERAEQERAAFQEQVIMAQQAALRELSTPLIPIVEGVVAMPLIGSIDSSRAQQVIESLLTGVSAQRAHTTILDITGVPVVDTQVANALIRAAQAVKLLGARVILTGIRPEVAQTLVGLGVDLGGIMTRSTLQSGVAEALGQAAGAAPAGRREQQRLR